MSSSSTWRISSRKPPKCGATKKSAVDAGRRADRAGVEKAPDAPDIGDVAAVLHNGMDAAGLPGALDDGACILWAVGERFFGQQMATDGASAENATSRRAAGTTTSNTTSRLGLVENGVEVGADGDAVELEFARPRPGPVGVEIDEADDGDLGESALAASSQALLMAPQPTRTTFIIPSSPPARPLQAAVTAFP